MKVWDFFIDTGGTFTDCLALTPEKEEIRVKVLSRSVLTAKIIKQVSKNELILSESADWPDNFPCGFSFMFSSMNQKKLEVKKWDREKRKLRLSDQIEIVGVENQTIELHSGWEAPILAIRLIFARRKEKFENNFIRVRLATTKCTNALLEETGETPILFITEGFSDLLSIGDQRRKDLFDLIPRKRKTFVRKCVEVRERTNKRGIVESTPDLEFIKSEGKKNLDKGHNVAVVSFLNSYLNNENEEIVSALLRKMGFSIVVESARNYPFAKWLTRSESAVMEAYLQPVLKEYLKNLSFGLGENSHLLIMNSSGGLVPNNIYRAVDSMLSGPAAGVVGASVVSRSAGLEKIINLDMGGTSTDVSRFTGKFSYQSLFQVGEAYMANLALDIETVAAGGGSICRIEDERLLVGPESAGSFPGPSCYGFGGPFCLTDVNLLLGRLEPKQFPTPISIVSAKNKLDELIGKSGLSEKELLLGFLAIADETMARAIRKISVEQGYDPTDHALVSFGGAGGQHICGVAEKLGINKILYPSDAGLLSAYGLSKSRMEHHVEKQLDIKLLNFDISKVEEKLVQEGMDQMSLYSSNVSVVRKTVSVRMKGQEEGLELDYECQEQIQELYARKFHEIFGYFNNSNVAEIYLLRIHFAVPEEKFGHEKFQKKSSERTYRDETILRSSLNFGDSLDGPILVVDSFGTLWINDGWRGVVGTKGSILIEKIKNRRCLELKPLIRNELFKSRFLCMVDEMGVQLRRTSLSVNIRERLDFSCALLNEEGFLIANAPHIPVHLGALGICVRESVRHLSSIEPGDIIITNHPMYGGSHLPDITVFAPFFSEDHKLVGYLANRAHHAEIGGVLPGSMPSGTRNLSEEGVVIEPQYLFRKDISKMDDISKLLLSGRFPTRQINENMADISAQVASIRRGLVEIKKITSEYSVHEIKKQMKNIFEFSAECSEMFLKGFESKSFHSTQFFDDGDKLELKLKIRNGKAVFDFSGSSICREDNFNTTEAIVHSCVCYCLRTLISKNIPLNEGILNCVSIIIPKGTVLSPFFNSISGDGFPAVAGGNVEVSQKIVDLIMSAMGGVANSQGTMNNVTFGNSSFSHYETIGGGSGATIGSDGTSAVQVHMTNTSITDPEIIESSFPVRLNSFKIRKDSGGEGRWRGGDGIEREYYFEEKIKLSLLTQNRKHGPQGIVGGSCGMPGEQFLIRSNGESELLSDSVSVTVYPGDSLIIRTPGGGGAGKAGNQ